LLEYGADPNLKSEHGSLPLDEAIKIGNKEIVDLLRNYGAQSSREKEEL
jgi:ankyrin repeat protein